MFQFPESRRAADGAPSVGAATSRTTARATPRITGPCPNNYMASRSTHEDPLAPRHLPEQRARPVRGRTAGPFAAPRLARWFAPLLLVVLLTGGCTDWPWHRHGGNSRGALSSCAPVHKGDSGNCVWGVQNALYARGLLAGVDGTFGSRTEQAVRGFQESQGLNTDGVAGPETLQALESSLRDRLLGSLSYRFDRQTTRRISKALGSGVGVDAGTGAFCAVLTKSLASTVCEFLVPIGADAVRDATRDAVGRNACLKVDLSHLPPILSSDGGSKCT